ncbi:hypothetical protein [Geomonas propionica]|uniref:hypothetical protein n=1 Tax=Geomonas propionica TaxID=2798582 RepID=UPI001F2D35FB|nr:hypothetical protein [Geomonas propionica]
MGKARSSKFLPVAEATMNMAGFFGTMLEENEDYLFLSSLKFLVIVPILNRFVETLGLTWTHMVVKLGFTILKQMRLLDFKWFPGR